MERVDHVPRGDGALSLEGISEGREAVKHAHTHAHARTDKVHTHQPVQPWPHLGPSGLRTLRRQDYYGGMPQPLDSTPAQGSPAHLLTLQGRPCFAILTASSP